MMKATKLLLLTGILLLSTSAAFAQDRPDEGTVGITASLQSNQTNIKVPIWASEKIVIAPVVGLTHQDDNFTTLNVGLTPRFYQSLGDDFATYIGAQGILQHTSTEAGADNSDFLLGALGGGEYFLDEHFSLGVEGQLNFGIADGGDNTIFTSAAVNGTFYF